MPSEHADSKCTYVYYKYLKEFVVKFRENAILTFFDDKATVPVGEPLHAVSTNLRTHNRSIGVGNVVIVALDHEWKVCGLVPSIVLVCVTFLIPSKVPFVSGTPYITTKEKILEKSNPFHHATQLTNISMQITLPKELVLTSKFY